MTAFLSTGDTMPLEPTKDPAQCGEGGRLNTTEARYHILLILNHKAASMTGVAKIYNRYAYGKEKREALQLWSDHVDWQVRQAERKPAVSLDAAQAT